MPEKELGIPDLAPLREPETDCHRPAVQVRDVRQEFPPSAPWREVVLSPAPVKSQDEEGRLLQFFCGCLHTPRPQLLQSLVLRTRRNHLSPRAFWVDGEHEPMLLCPLCSGTNLGEIIAAFSRDERCAHLPSGPPERRAPEGLLHHPSDVLSSHLAQGKIDEKRVAQPDMVGRHHDRPGVREIDLVRVEHHLDPQNEAQSIQQHRREPRLQGSEPGPVLHGLEHSQALVTDYEDSQRREEAEAGHSGPDKREESREDLERLHACEPL